MVNMEAIELPYVKLLLTACILTCTMPKLVGLDLYSPTSVLVPAHDKHQVTSGQDSEVSVEPWLVSVGDNTRTRLMTSV